MRSRLLLIFCLFSVPASAQAVSWHRLNVYKLDAVLAPARLTDRQRASIRSFILQNVSMTDCGGDDPGVFTYSVAPLGRPGLVYVSPGAGCFRGGQGSNASLWIVDMSSPHLRLLGTPSGWGLGIQPHTAHGLHDFVTGWHMSAFETGLGWYRFDGHSYRLLSSATAYSMDDMGTERMTQERRRCTAANKTCNLIRYNH